MSAPAESDRNSVQVVSFLKKQIQNALLHGKSKIADAVRIVVMDNLHNQRRESDALGMHLVSAAVKRLQERKI